MSTPEEWAIAFARQAQADFQTWVRLETLGGVPACHQLLFLQMTCEKLTKAHLCKSGKNPNDVQGSHAYIAKNLPIVIAQQVAFSRPKNSAWVLQICAQLAREIEMLAPAVRRGGRRPDNCEYPWADSAGKLHVPLDWTFVPSKLLSAPAGRTFVKLIHEALSRLLREAGAG